MFTAESALVQIWVKYIKEGKYSEGQVPRLSNLQEMVFQLLNV